jgi:dimethylargininase
LRIAITRAVSPSIERCQLTHLAREAIDLSTAQAQHRAYEDRLVELGCQILRLPVEPDLPDSVFVEDTAIVLNEVAVITRPGAASRRPETASVAHALAAYRELFHIEPPGTIDGGDILRVGRTLFAGLSSRSNEAGLEQLRTHASRFGYTLKPVEVRGCLHLKSAVTQVAEDTLLIHRDWVDGTAFDDMEMIDVDPSEPFGANALLVGDAVIYPRAYSRTRERLERRDITVKAVRMSELAKAEGGVTCCSLIVQV